MIALQDWLWMLARRSLLWSGGGHAGPNLDASATPVELMSDALGGIPSLPSVVSLPESFGRMQV